MAELSYKWKRFWYPRGTTVDLSDSGYLTDPDLRGYVYNPNLVSFEMIANTPCLVLIGEPGIGKTTAIKEALKQVPEGEEKDDFGLGDYGSGEDLCNAIFRTTKFQAWIDGTHQLHLFLDSFDEGCLLIKNLAKILERELKVQKISDNRNRLKFRITCRTNDWSLVLEKTLKELWGENDVGIYQIAPLRRVDVIEAATVNNLDSNHFLQEIDNRDTVPLAIMPISLKFLLKRYNQNQQLPKSQKELYLDGCEYLCRENNAYRTEAKFLANLSPKQLLIVAARIAAVTIFCNRAAICKNLELCSAEDDVDIEELGGSKEKTEESLFSITRNEIEETLGTALFSSVSIRHSLANTHLPANTHRIGFAHKTYAEFLAAWYLEQNQMSLPQIMSLIQHPDGNLIPQLHETAAWLANLLPNVFREIMKSDPDVLLKSDVANANLEDKKNLVETLLKLYDEEKLLEPHLENYRHYRKLYHPHLAEQLQPYISDSNKNKQARLVAIDIAEVCQLLELQDDLVGIVTEYSQPIIIRLNAAQAIHSLNKIETKNKLKSLVLSNITNDPDSKLRIYLLNSLFPDCLNTEELFTVLNDKSLNFSGGLYYYDLPSKLNQYLLPDNLLVSLTWIEGKQAEANFFGKFERIIDTILLKAFENIETERVAEAIAKIVFYQLEHNEKILNHADDSEFLKALSNDDEKRCKILAATLPLLSNFQDNLQNYLSLLADASTPLVFTRDIPWMIKHLQASSEQEQQILANLIYWVFTHKEKKYLEIIRSATQSNPILAEVFTPSYFSYIDSIISQVQQYEEENQILFPEEPSVPYVLELLPAVPITELSDEDKIRAESLIRLPVPTTGEERNTVVNAAQVLIIYFEDAGWATLWPVIQQDTEFGREVMEKICFYALNSGNIESRLSEEQVTQLYIWLTEQYPSFYAERNQSANNDLLCPKHIIDRWKNLILCNLEERGTPKAVKALQQIIQQLPQLEGKLKPFLIKAQESNRRNTWIPAKPDEIIKLAKNQHARLVKSGNELLSIIIEALNKLQQRLQGETPAAIDLWNEIKWTQIKNLANMVLEKLNNNNKLKNSLPILEELWKLEAGDWRSIKDCSYIPKEEERLSDYIKGYLEETLKTKGIILNREVQIRRGELVDINVAAVVQNSAGEVDSVSVIIEVKGCWNKTDLNTAMKTQLIERYLKDYPCQYGLYLIVWFNCDKWDESDNRKKTTPNITFEKAQKQFNLQADQLSQQGVKVKAYILNAALR